MAGSVAKTRVSIASVSQTCMYETCISKTSVAKTRVAMASVAKAVVAQQVSVSIGLSLPLGNMNSSGRVGNIPSGSSVETTASRDSSGGKTGDVHIDRGGDAGVAGNVAKTSVAKTSVAQTMVDQSGLAQTSMTKTSMAKTGIAKSGVSQTITTVAQTSVSQQVRVGFSSTGNSQAEDRLKERE